MKMRDSLGALMLFLAVLGLLLVAPLSAQEKKAVSPKKLFPPGTASDWMKRKLELSQNVLAGLTQGDLDKVHTNANGLAFLGYLEKWVLAEKPEYKRQMVLYEFATIELSRQAKAKNLEGATLAYHQLTTSCVQCHKVVRDAKK